MDKLVDLQKGKEFTSDSALLLPGICPGEMRELLPLIKKCKPMVRAALFIISKKVETIPASIHGWLGKWHVLYLYHQIVFGQEKEWSTATHYNMDEPWKHFAKSKRAVTKEHPLYNSISLKHTEQGHPERQKADAWWPGDVGGGAEGLLLGTGFFGRWWKYCKIVVMGAQLSEYNKNH